ncbi:hypothetical protein CEXT_126281 [Caerostris extrusa]|uniref:Uncharacterized protein n=1 Tax=Caerostris extrusa TaxID=172846 RepID=A0AAV4XES9_CAEEX|nr:hypothetical protein CEXT_126281 [Caerostris extrusa]
MVAFITHRIAAILQLSRYRLTPSKRFSFLGTPESSPHTMPTGAFQRDQRHESLILPEFSPLFVCCIPPSIHPLILSLKHHSCHHFLQSSISYDDRGKMIIIIPTTVIKNRVLLTTTLFQTTLHIFVEGRCHQIVVRWGFLLLLGSRDGVVGEKGECGTEFN